MTLAQPAPAGGSAVTLVSNNALLTVPLSVTVAAGSTAASFNVEAAASLASNQAATVTATLSTFGQISLVHVTECGPQVFPAMTCPIPATASGDLLVIGWMSTDGGGATTITSIADNASGAGNVYSEAGNARALEAGSNSMADLWYAPNSNSGATAVTINPSPGGTGGTAVIWEFAGVNATNPLDQSAVLNSQPATTTPIGPSLAPNRASEAIVSIANIQGAATGIVADNRFTGDSTVGGNGWAHLVTSAPGTYAAQWNNPESGAYAASAVSFTAVSSSSSQTATIGLTAPPVFVSGVTCSPSILGQGAVGSCLVSLSQSAPAGGLTVALASNDVSLAVPATVTIGAGSTTATFSATAAALITSSQTVTLTAALTGSPQTATINQVEVVSGTFLASDGTIQIKLGTSTTAGELIVVEDAQNDYECTLTTVTDSAGSVYLPIYSYSLPGSRQLSGAWYLADAPSGITYIEVTKNCGRGAVFAGHYTGIATSGPLDQYTAAANVSTSPWNSSPVSTTAANELLIGSVFGLYNGANCNQSASGLWVNDIALTSGAWDGNNGNGAMYSHQIVSTAQTNVEYTGTDSGACNHYAGIATFKAAAAPSSPNSLQSTAVTLLPVLVSGVTCNPGDSRASRSLHLHGGANSARSGGRNKRHAGERQYFVHRPDIGCGSGGRDHRRLQRDHGSFHTRESDGDPYRDARQ